MKKNIVLKSLIGVVTSVTTAIGIAGIAVPEMVGFKQNMEEVAVIADEDIQITETVVDTEIISDETNIVEAADVAEEIITEAEDIVDDEQQAVEQQVVADDSDKSDKNETIGNAGSNQSTGNNHSNTDNNNQVVETTPEPTQPAPTETEPAQPAHTHSWIEHTATKQVWVPHIVVVDDYEYRVVGRTDNVYICGCGFTTTDRDIIADHIKSNILAGNYEHGGFTSQPGHDIIEEVKIGSHEEDHGYYENQTYVDYYYCDCGAIK